MNISINSWPKRYIQNPQMWSGDYTAFRGLLYSKVITQKVTPSSYGHDSYSDLNKFISSNTWASGVIPLVYQCLLYLWWKILSSRHFGKKSCDTRCKAVIDRIKDDLKAWTVSLPWNGMVCLFYVNSCVASVIDYKLCNWLWANIWSYPRKNTVGNRHLKLGT